MVRWPALSIRFRRPGGTRSPLSLMMRVDATATFVAVRS